MCLYILSLLRVINIMEYKNKLEIQKREKLHNPAV